MVAIKLLALFVVVAFLLLPALSNFCCNDAIVDAFPVAPVVPFVVAAARFPTNLLLLIALLLLLMLLLLLNALMSFVFALFDCHFGL